MSSKSGGGASLTALKVLLEDSGSRRFAGWAPDNHPADPKHLSKILKIATRPTGLTLYVCRITFESAEVEAQILDWKTRSTHPGKLRCKQVLDFRTTEKPDLDRALQIVSEFGIPHLVEIEEEILSIENVPMDGSSDWEVPLKKELMTWLTFPGFRRKAG